MSCGRIAGTCGQGRNNRVASRFAGAFERAAGASSECIVSFVIAISWVASPLITLSTPKMGG